LLPIKNNHSSSPAIIFPAPDAACRNPRLDPLLDHHDDLKDGLQQHRGQQREGERLGEHLPEVLHEQIQHHYIHEEIDNGRRDARISERLRAIPVLGGHKRTLGAARAYWDPNRSHAVWTT
jgi:hypothetical protein